MDCPAFEQAYWIGDARIEALVNNYTYGAYELTRRSIGMVGGSLTKSELPEAQVPTSRQYRSYRMGFAVASIL